MRVTPVNESDDQIQDNMTNNVKDALMFLKMSGQKQVPVQTVFNEFKKRGIVVSLQQLQDMFPPGSGIISSVNNQFVEFGGDDDQAAGTPENSGKTSDEIVGDLANKAINKRV